MNPWALLPSASIRLERCAGVVSRQRGLDSHQAATAALLHIAKRARTVQLLWPANSELTGQQIAAASE